MVGIISVRRSTKDAVAMYESLRILIINNTGKREEGSSKLIDQSREVKMSINITDIRAEGKMEAIAKNVIFQTGLFFVLGVTFGVISKYSDTSIANGLSGMILGFIGNLTTRLKT